MYATRLHQAERRCNICFKRWIFLPQRQPFSNDSIEPTSKGTYRWILIVGSDQEELVPCIPGNLCVERVLREKAQNSPEGSGGEDRTKIFQVSQHLVCFLGPGLRCGLTPLRINQEPSTVRTKYRNVWNSEKRLPV